MTAVQVRIQRAGYGLKNGLPWARGEAFAQAAQAAQVSVTWDATFLTNGLISSDLLVSQNSRQLSAA